MLIGKGREYDAGRIRKKVDLYIQVKENAKEIRDEYNATKATEPESRQVFNSLEDAEKYKREIETYNRNVEIAEKARFATSADVSRLAAELIPLRTCARGLRRLTETNTEY